MKNYNNFMKHENGNLAVGFIKSRKAEHKVMDFCERLIAAGDEEGCEILCVDVDRGGIPRAAKAGGEPGGRQGSCAPSLPSLQVRLWEGFVTFPR